MGCQPLRSIGSIQSLQPIQPIQPVQLVQPIYLTRPIAPSQSVERNADSVTPLSSPTLSTATTATGTTTTPIYSTCKVVIRLVPAFESRSETHPCQRSLQLHTPAASFISMWLLIEVGMAQSI